MFSVYLFRFSNGKKYIGATNNYRRRFSEHQQFAKEILPRQVIHRALRKYGWGDVVYSFLGHFKTEQEAHEFEKACIVKFKTKVPHGYNMTDGGDGVLNPTPETIRRRSESLKKAFTDPGERKKRSERMQSLWQDEKKRGEIIEGIKAHWAKPGNKENRNEKIRQTKADPEKRRQQSERMIAWWAIPENREKHSEKMKQTNKRRPENMERQSEGMKQFDKRRKDWDTPGYKERQSERIEQFFKHRREEFR